MCIYNNYSFKDILLSLSNSEEITILSLSPKDMSALKRKINNFNKVTGRCIKLYKDSIIEL